jgi:hypothetical protein
VQTVRNGKIVRVRSYMDRRDALEAAGLSEDEAQSSPSLIVARQPPELRPVGAGVGPSFQLL